ncbi:MAG: hypothetical protein QXU40_00145 [Candidatus Pacearchaeota archaeon]
MPNVIDMQKIRYLNLFEKISGVRAKFCFVYNRNLIFCVPRRSIKRAIGRKGINLKKIGGILKRRVRIIAEPSKSRGIESFLRSIVSPIDIKKNRVDEEKVIIEGGHNKAALIGRNKGKMIELQKIIKDFFGKKLRIV